MEDLKQRVRMVFETLNLLGPILISQNVGPKLLVAHTHSVDHHGIVLSGKFWNYYHARDFKSEPTFRLVFELEVHPEADSTSLKKAFEQLRALQARNVQFTAEETQAIAHMVLSGEMAEFLK